MDKINNELPIELKNNIKNYSIFKPEDNEELKDAVEDQYLYNNETLKKYNHISTWDTSLITDMSNLFNYYDEDVPFHEQYDSKYYSFSSNEFNEDISKWNVSNVTNMSGMFSNAYEFNQNINEWDVSNVTDMSFMFHRAKNFDQPLNNWDVSNVTNMTSMFYSAHKFNQPLDSWNLSKVQDISYIFYKAKKFNQDINNWELFSFDSKREIFNNNNKNIEQNNIKWYNLDNY